MSTTQDSIGLADLLDEVDRDLDDFRRKHEKDYGVKNVTLWWDLNRERLLVRHEGRRVSRKSARRRRGWITAVGCVVTFALGVLVTLLAA